MQGRFEFRTTMKDQQVADFLLDADCHVASRAGIVARFPRVAMLLAMTGVGRSMRFDLTASDGGSKGERIATASLRTGFAMTVVGGFIRSRIVGFNREGAGSVPAFRNQNGYGGSAGAVFLSARKKPCEKISCEN